MSTNATMSVGAGTFDRLVARRQAYVAAQRAEAAAMDADPCDRRCKCGMMAPFAAAAAEAYADLRAAEESYRAYHAAFTDIRPES